MPISKIIPTESLYQEQILIRATHKHSYMFGSALCITILLLISRTKFIQTILNVSSENENDSVINASIFSWLLGLPDPKDPNNPNNIPNQNNRPNKFSIFITIIAIFWILGVDNIIYIYSFITLTNFRILGLFTSSLTILFCLFCAFWLTKFHNNAVVIPKYIPFKKFLLFLRRYALNNEYEWLYNLFIGHARFQLIVLVLCSIGYYILSDS